MSNLDAKLRKRMREEIRMLQQRLGANPDHGLRYGGRRAAVRLEFLGHGVYPLPPE